MSASDQALSKLQLDCGLPMEECRQALEQHGGDPEAALLALIDSDRVATDALNPDTVSNACFCRAVRRNKIALFRKMHDSGGSPLQRLLGGVTKDLGLGGEVKDKLNDAFKQAFAGAMSQKFQQTPEEMADEEERKQAARRDVIRRTNPQAPANAGEWARIHNRSNRRLARLKANPKTLDCPPFPAMPMGTHDWQGKDILPAWAGTQARQGGYTSMSDDKPSDGTVTVILPRLGDDNDANPRPPAPQFVAAYRHFKENALAIMDAVLAALLAEYGPLRARWMKGNPDLTEEDLPVIESVAQMKNNVGLGIVHMLPIARDGLAYIGLELGCTWDEEHGAGVIVHGSRVVAVGAGDQAFDIPDCFRDGGRDLEQRIEPKPYLTIEAADRGETWPPRN